jgi:hypothetical protein
MMDVRTAIALATVFVVSVFGQDGAIDSKAELRRSVAAARTPADHVRLADYFYKAAQSYAQQEKEEELIAARWQEQYQNRTKTPNPWRSAMNLASYYRELTTSAIAHAREQDRLARAGTGSQH